MVGSLHKFHTWYVDAFWWEEEPNCFWVRVKGHLGHRAENLVNKISRGRKLRWISYLVCRCVMVRGRTVIFGGGQRSSGVTRGQTLKILLTRYLKLGSLDKFHTWYVDGLWWEEEPYCFWWGSKVIWGHRGSNSENLLNMISRGRKLR